MAKDKIEETKTVEKPDMTPDQALNADWPAKHKQLAPYITKDGRMRGGLKPSEQVKAKEILKGYGF